MKDYKKILEGVVNIINTTEKSDIGFTNICNYIGEKCPELTNEDERIRKEIIATIHLYYGEPLEDEAKEMIAWLEKQGVKPDGWNDKDEEIRQELIEMIKEDWPGRSDVIAWIEKQKERNTNTHLPSFDEAQGTPIVKQGEKKPAEWTFEAKGWDKEQIQKCITWLQSLRPQNTWKPSDEMLEALYRVIPENVMEKSENEILLDKLYQGLKYGRVLSKK